MFSYFCIKRSNWHCNSLWTEDGRWIGRCDQSTTRYVRRGTQISINKSVLIFIYLMTEGKKRGYYFRSAEMSTTTTNYILPLLTSSISDCLPLPDSTSCWNSQLFLISLIMIVIIMVKLFQIALFQKNFTNYLLNVLLSSILPSSWHIINIVTTARPIFC